MKPYKGKKNSVYMVKWVFCVYVGRKKIEVKCIQGKICRHKQMWRKAVM
jgi:hypothetical protein